MLVLALLATAACRPDAATTEQATLPSALTVEPATGPADTLHLPAGIVQLRPSTVQAFKQLPARGLPDVANDSLVEVKSLGPAQGQVRRQGLDLVFQPERGAAVRLHSTPAAGFTLENGAGVRYQYQGSLPAAHQWVVRAWYWESAGTVLVDQRTGRHLEVLGDTAPSADGRFVVLTSPGLGGGDQPNALSLVKIDEQGPQLLWQREPTAWEPQEVRWANPGIAIMKLRRVNAQGALLDDAPAAYVELPLPH
jgi:hypothetical protein